MLAWFRAPELWTGNPEVGQQWFHANSQGLPYLDKIIGKLLGQDANFKHPLLGSFMATYAQWCLAQNVSPKGRVFLLMKAVRFQVEHHRQKGITLNNLMSLKVESFKQGDIRHFMNRVQLGLSELRTDEIKDPDLMFTWLWEQFRGWKEISGKIEKINESKEGSHRRDFSYLWRIINNKMITFNTDTNHDVLSKAYTTGKMIGGIVPGSPAKGGGGKSGKDKKDKKNKGDPKGGKGDPKGSGGGKSGGKVDGKGKPQRTINQAKAASTPPGQRTMEQQKLIACAYRLTPTGCPYGDKCRYSHKDKDVTPELRARFPNWVPGAAAHANDKKTMLPPSLPKLLELPLQS